MKKIWKLIEEHPLHLLFYIFIILIVVFFIILNIHYNKGYKNGYNDCLQELKDKYSSPVERNVIDSIYITRDSIIERTKYIKVIQHDTIEKVYNLNADSTLDLFYKLVSE